jgi:serine/threonine-protein kinase
MPDGVSGGDGFGRAGVGAGHLSTLLQELARAPGDALHRAWQQRLRPGDTVGRFEILREIGRGGFGVVYEAFDRQLGRSVAFKTLRPGRTGHELSADWILREAEAVARLDHPVIVTLYDVGRCDSGPYLVEEMLRGETLEQRLRAGPLPAREVVGMGLEVARGLAHAHGRGVLHRDLKPGNVLLTEDGRVKLLDFGLAHLLGTRGLPGTGTPAYMAPEQLRGEETGPAADVFALGATLFEALAGRAAFEVKEGRSASLDPGPPPALPEGTPPMLAALIGRCLARDPRMRPANGPAVAEDLLAVQRALDHAGLRRGEAAARAPAWRRSLRLAVPLAVVAAVAAGAAHLVSRRSRSATEAIPPATAPPVLPSVAVLPFADMSPGRDQEYFADGVAEEILNALVQVEGLHVTGRTSSFSFRGKQAELGEIGRRLKVSTVLEGSVRRSGNRVRITAQLVNTSDGFNLWSRVFDRELRDIFAVQEEIARDVVEALKVKLLPGRAPSTKWSRTANPEVYNQYLHGQEFLRRGTLADFRRALAAYQKAIALEPGYALAWAGVSFAASRSAGFEDVPGPELRERALAAAERAVVLAPDLADAYLARGMVRRDFQFDWAGAEADHERALALRPADARNTESRAYLLGILGRQPEALAAARRATELDPLDPQAWATLGAVRYFRRELDSAREALQVALEISADHAEAMVTLCYVLVASGRASEAIALARTSRMEWSRLTCTALAEHDLGNLGRSQAALEALMATNAEGAAYQIAQNFSWRGEPDRAFEWLERAYAQRDSGLPTAKSDPLLRPLHQDRRWKPFLEMLKLPVD